MSTITQLTTGPADLVGAQALPVPRPIEREPKKPRPAGRPLIDGNDRLVIRDGLDNGLLVYTVIDRVTGKVMAQIPREDLARLAARPDYEAGQVVDTTV